jgi:hypothetical protein
MSADPSVARTEAEQARLKSLWPDEFSDGERCALQRDVGRHWRRGVRLRANLLLFSAMASQARLVCLCRRRRLLRPPAAPLSGRAVRVSKTFAACNRAVLSPPVRASNKISCAWSRACSLSS